MSQTRLIIGCGYLGRRVAARWIAGGDSVAVLTRSTKHADQFRAAGIAPILGDVLRSESLTALPDVDTVLWAVGWDRSSGASQQEVYVNGLENVLGQVGGRCSQWLSISSSSVYGQIHGEWIDEASPCEPTQSNGQVVLAAERLLEAWCRDHQNRPATTILRLSGIYGPGRLLSRVAALQAGEPLAGNPDAWLNLIHIDDAADAVVACADSDHSESLFLISDNEPLTRRTYYQTLAQLVSAPEPRFAEVDAGSGGTRTTGLNKRCRNVLARQVLQWEPRFPTYREGLPQAVRESGRGTP